TGGSSAIAHGLLHGADDYVTSLDGPDGLGARTTAHLLVNQERRRHSSRQLGGFELDVAARRVHSPTNSVVLTPLECQMARQLFEAEGHVVTTESLMGIGGQRARTRRAVEQQMYRLRTRFAEVSAGLSAQLSIVTMYGTGYRLEVGEITG